MTPSVRHRAIEVHYYYYYYCFNFKKHAFPQIVNNCLWSRLELALMNYWCLLIIIIIIIIIIKLLLSYSRAITKVSRAIICVGDDASIITNTDWFNTNNIVPTPLNICQTSDSIYNHQKKMLSMINLIFYYIIYLCNHGWHGYFSTA